MLAAPLVAPRISRVVAGRARANCWIVAAPTGEALVVDPGDEAEAIARAVERLGVRPVALVATHGHADHLGAAAELRRVWSVPLVLHRLDRATLRRANLLQLAFGHRAIELPEVDRWLDGGEEELRFGGCVATAVATPGHTPGSVSLAVEAGDGPMHLLTGDTLLRGRVGRTDLPGGSPDEIRRSLELLAASPRTTVLHPGHGDESELGEELDGNAELRELLR